MSVYRQYASFLKTYKVDKNAPWTHISFGPPWGKYYIPDNKIADLYRLYWKMLQTNKVYMIEKASEVCPLFVDIDFKHTCDDRVYTDDDVAYILAKIRNIVKKYYPISYVECYVYKKDVPTYDRKKSIYRDGIHVICPELAIPKNIRKMMLKDFVKDTERGWVHLPLLNKDVIDTSIYDRWIMHGSRKYRGSVYKLTQPRIQEDINILRKLSVRKRTDAMKLRDDIEILKPEQLKRIPRNPQPCNIDNVHRLVSMLSFNRACRYDTWIRVGWALHNIDPGLLDLFKEFSRRCIDKYDEVMCERVWINARDNGLGIEDLERWVRQDNLI